MPPPLMMRLTINDATDCLRFRNLRRRRDIAVEIRAGIHRDRILDDVRQWPSLYTDTIF